MVDFEGNYDAYVNEGGEMLFGLRYREEEPKNPKIVYDGKEHALFYRVNDNVVVLGHLNLSLHSKLAAVEKVLIAEVDGEEIMREYFAVVQHVKKLPISKKILKQLDKGQ